MRRFGLLFLVPLVSLFSAEQLQAQLPMPPPDIHRPVLHLPVKQAAPIATPLVHRAQALRAPALLSSNVTPMVCNTDAQAAGAALCGYVKVPFDRKHPEQGTIGIYFEQYLNGSGGPAVSAILGNIGGPGQTTTGFRGEFLSIFGPNLDVHDLLLIDDRGRGLSATINCPPLQQGTVSFDQGVADCAKQLGMAASRYGTGDIAEDVDAVRAALGYDLIDYYGGSYGGADVSAYATHFGNRLRSIVLDAPCGAPYLDETRFAIEWYRTHAEVPTTSRQCERSPLCSFDHPFSDAELDALIATLRWKPVVGEAYDANGNLAQVRMDEAALLNYVIDNPTGKFLSTGEVFAAARSLWQGDTRPLLRLGAEGYFPVNPNYGDPMTGFSAGAYLATSCVDVKQPYDWSSPISERMEQLHEAIYDLPFWYFAPFTREVSTGLVFSYGGINGGRACNYWEKPTASSPVLPLYPIYPFAPTLVLTGDLDRRVPHAEVSKVAALFPNSTLVSVAGAGHETIWWGQCAPNLASGFVETLQVPDTTCAKSPETIWPSVGRFPLYAKDARPAEPDSSGQNQIGTHEEKVASVAVATMVDALQRSIIGSGNGVGLRGGTFQTIYSPLWNTTLTNCAFASDVLVSGTITWFSDNSLSAELYVTGPGTAGGTLYVNGGFLVFGGPLGNFSVTGMLGGKQVAVLVPEA